MSDDTDCSIVRSSLADWGSTHCSRSYIQEEGGGGGGGGGGREEREREKEREGEGERERGVGKIFRGHDPTHD